MHVILILEIIKKKWRIWRNKNLQLGFRLGGIDKAGKQTWQGGSEGWSRHIVFGRALEHPVPRNIKADPPCSETAPFPFSAKIELWFSIL